MTIHTISVEDQIAAIDRLLVDHRGHPRNEALKAIASDLRARLDRRQATAALTELQKRIQNVKASKASLGYSQGTLIALGQELVGRWPVVQLALERFELEVSQ